MKAFAEYLRLDNTLLYRINCFFYENACQSVFKKLETNVEKKMLKPSIEPCLFFSIYASDIPLVYENHLVASLSQL